ncbi:MAG: C-terminal binding protein [Armatimonadota bacterium]
MATESAAGGELLVVDTTGRSDYPREALAQLGGLPVRLEPRRAGSTEELVECAADADAILIGGVAVTREALQTLPRLRGIVRYGVGLDNVDLDAADELGVQVRNVHDFCTEEIADHALGMLLALVRRICHFAQRTRAGSWSAGRDAQIRRLRGQQAGVIGLGAIGSALATRLQALGMEVVAWDPYVEPAAARELGVALVELKELLRGSDVISINCPLTDETRHLIGGAELSLMKPGAILINTARGAIIDERALIEALEAGEIAAAGLDVLEQEPPEEGNPLPGMPNVIVTPHVAWLSHRAKHDLVVGAFRQLAEVLEKSRTRQ